MPILDNVVLTTNCGECKKEIIFDAKNVVQSAIRTIKCDADDCTKEVIYDRKDEAATFQAPENAWLKTTRVVQSADGRNIVYCSDSCEVKGAATGKHNVPEPPKVAVASPAHVEAAAKLAAARKNADQALRDGQPTKVQLTDN